MTFKLKLISDFLITVLAMVVLPKRPLGGDNIKLHPANQLYTIPGYASVAHREALARSKHKKVRQHQKDKTRALHEALAGLRRVDESAPKRHPLLDDWARVEADWVAATGCRGGD